MSQVKEIFVPMPTEELHWGEYSFYRLYPHHIQQITLMLIGQKPAIFIEDYMSFNEAVKRDFFIQKVKGGWGSTHYVISNQKDKFEKFIKEGLEYIEGEEIPEFKHKEMGIVLGYPPLAAESFDEKDMNTWTMIRFHGMNFGVQEKDVAECIEWLRRTYSIPEEYQTESFYVSWTDTEGKEIYF